MSNAQPNTKTEGFMANYRVLRDVAEEMRKSSQDIDIDIMLENVQKSMRARDACKRRIAQVEAALKEAIEEQGG